MLLAFIGLVYDTQKYIYINANIQYELRDIVNVRINTSSDMFVKIVALCLYHNCIP